METAMPKLKDGELIGSFVSLRLLDNPA